jgi:large subunit ribosomal protein L24
MIKKGDKVIVTKGREKGKKGVISIVNKKDGRVIIDGINLRSRHQKSRKRGAVGEIVSVPQPISISNVMLIDPKTGKGTRVGVKMVKDKKVRVARKSGQEV